MDLILIANIITCAGAFAGFLYGMFRFFRPRTAVYAQMITLASGCMAFGRLYQVIRIVTINGDLEEFHLGILGVIGCLLFLFSANFGLMDGIVDDGAEEYRKYRIVPLAVPILAAAIYLAFFLFTDLALTVKIASFFVSALVVAASYYSLKHLIFPDVELGFFECMRPYNLLALILELLCMSEMIFISREMEAMTLLTGILMGILLPAIVFAVDRGIKKWSI